MTQNNANMIKNSKHSIRSHPGPFQMWGPVWLYRAPVHKDVLCHPLRSIQMFAMAQTRIWDGVLVVVVVF